MSKYVYFQDAHNSGKNSTHYISDYFQDNLLMFDEILEIAKEVKAKAIIDGGDLIHVPEPTYRILDELADRVEKVQIPIYSLLGNHAERYHSMEHSRYTGMMHLIKRSKYFNYLDEIIGKDYYIKGIEYSHTIEEDIKKNGIELRVEASGMWQIAIVHAFVCPKEFPYADHVVCDDIKTNADIVLVAHYHSQWEKKVGNTLYKDIGCLGRRSITEKDIEPSVLIIDTEKRTIEQRFLKSAKSAEEIFDLDKLEEIKANKKGMDEFVKSIEDVSFQEMSIKDTIKFIAKEKEFTQEPVDLILNKMEKL